MQDYPPFAFDGDAVAASVASMLNEVAECTKEQERFKASFKAPDVDEIKDCFNHNCTVWGTLNLSTEDRALESKSESIDIPILYPFNGVFVLGNGNGQIHRPTKARLMFWQPCLVRRPGLWFLKERKDGDADNPERFVFLGGSDGRRLISPANKQKKNKTSAVNQKKIVSSEVIYDVVDGYGKLMELVGAK